MGRHEHEIFRDSLSKVRVENSEGQELRVCNSCGGGGCADCKNAGMVVAKSKAKAKQPNEGK